MIQKLTPYILSFAIAASSFGAATIVIPSKSIQTVSVNNVTADVVPMPWPSEPRPQGQAEGFIKQFDGAEFPLIRFTLPTFECIVEPFGTWKSIPLGNRYSILLGSTDSSVTFGVSQFKNGEFLTSLSQDEWIRYTHFLKTSDPNITFNFESSNLDTNDGLYVLGNKYREVVYEISTPKAKPIMVQEIFTFVKDQLTVFTIKGSKEDVLRKRGATHAMICRMDYPNSEEE